MTRQEAYKFRQLIEQSAQTVPDESANEMVVLFPKWSGESSYAEGYKVQHNGKLYKALTAIAANPAWTPDVAPTLWGLISAPSELGTKGNPITADVGLTYRQGLFYAESGKLYLCIRQDTPEGTRLFFLPSQLVGNYFAEVSTDG